MAEKHYTAVIEVKEVGEAGTITKPTREVTDVARIVVRAETLEKLRARMLSHVELIEED